MIPAMLSAHEWPAPAASFTAPLIGQIAWGVAKGHGSFLTLEFGQPSLIVHEYPSRMRRSALVVGTVSVWIYCCHWAITRDGAQRAWSEDDAATIDRAAADLNGQRLTAITVDPVSGRSQFHFDLGGAIVTWPYGGDAGEEQWSISHAGAVLRINAAGQFQIAATDTPLSDDDWLPLA